MGRRDVKKSWQEIEIEPTSLCFTCSHKECLHSPSYQVRANWGAQKTGYTNISYMVYVHINFVFTIGFFILNNNFRSRFQWSRKWHKNWHLWSRQYSRVGGKGGKCLWKKLHEVSSYRSGNFALIKTVLFWWRYMYRTMPFGY